MMISHVKIKNYRALRSVDVDLKPLTVLVGPNDSGKTSFLNVLRRTLTEDPHYSAIDHWHHRLSNAIHVEIQTSDKALVYSDDGNAYYTHSRNQNVRGNHNLVKGEIGHLLPISQYELPAQGVAMTSLGLTDGDGPKVPDQFGNWVPGLLDYYNRNDKKRFTSITDAMRRLVPGLQDLKIGAPDLNSRRIDFVINDGLVINGNDVSAGVRLLLFFVSVAYHPFPPRLILLEEPETGLHPRRLADVMGLLRYITTGEFGGYAAQVILTTHSPYLLDSVDLNTDQVLVFRREEDGSRAAEAADRDRLKSFLNEFMLGEIWFNLGEDGLVAKHQ